MSDKKKNTTDKKISARKSTKPKEKKLNEKISELEEQLKEAEDKILRIHAEYDNYRKRAARELAETRSYVKADTLTPILNVFDHFKMAVDAMDQTDDMKVVKDGMKMISSEFDKAMDDLGLEELNAIGKQFDPNYHEAVANEESEEEEEGTVIKQWRCGYKIGDRLLRPATVVVSTGKANKEE